MSKYQKLLDEIAEVTGGIEEEDNEEYSERATALLKKIEAAKVKKVRRW